MSLPDLPPPVDRPVGPVLVVTPGDEVTLLHVPADLPVEPAAIAATGQGHLIVLTGARDATADAATALVADGAAPTGVVIEVSVGPGPAPRDLAASATGFGVVLTAPPGTGDEQAAWELGMLTRVLTDGARTVRGADPVRFRRVRAVVAAIDAATEGSGGS